MIWIVVHFAQFPFYFFFFFISGNIGHLNVFCISSLYLTPRSAVSAEPAMIVPNMFCLSENISLCLCLISCAAALRKAWRRGRGPRRAFGPRHEALMTQLFQWLFLSPNSLLSGSTQLYKSISSITSHYHTVHPELRVSTLPRKWKTLVGWSHPWWCFSFSFLLSVIAFLSGWIYEELRGPGSSPCLQKKKEKSGSMKLQSILRFEWWESFVSFIFCYKADSDLLNHISSGTVEHFIDGIITKVHAYCSSSSNDSVCFATW